MLTVLMTAFLSFSIISGTDALRDDPYATSTISDITSGQISKYEGNAGGSNYANNVPTPNITKGDFEVSWWRNGLIGRHQMTSIGDYEYEGVLPINQLTDTYVGKMLKSFTITESVTTTATNSISTTVELNYTWTTKLLEKIKYGIFELGSENSASFEMSVSNTTAYTYSKTVTSTVTYELDETIVKNEIFCVCEAAHVFKIKCEKWQYDDYWWGKSEVSGSRSEYYTYVAIDKVVTLLLNNKTVLL